MPYESRDSKESNQIPSLDLNHLRQGKARQLYLYSTFHTQGRLKVLHIETLAYNKRK